MKKIVLILLALGCFSLSNAQTTTTDSTKTKVEGTNAMPNITIKDVDGNAVNIKALADSGKITVISFWALWCGPCIKELDNTKELLPDWIKNYNVQYFAISIDDARTTNKVKPFAAQRGWEYTILLDPNKDLARELNVNNPPLLLIYNANGELIYQHQGYTEGSEYDVEDKLKEITKK